MCTSEIWNDESHNSLAAVGWSFGGMLIIPSALVQTTVKAIWFEAPSIDFLVLPQIAVGTAMCAVALWDSETC